MSIEAEIREIIESAGAPIRIDELGQPRGTVIGGRRRTPVLVAATVVALVGVAGTIVALNARDRDHARTNSGPEVSVSLPTTLPPSQIVPPQPVAPVGDEYPIHRVNDVEVPTLHGPTAEVIDAASIRFWKTNDDTVMTFRTVRALGDLAVEFSCLGNLDGTGAEYGCSPSAYSPFGPDWLGSSGVGGAV